MIIVGCDAGITGALCLINTLYQEKCCILDMPTERKNGRNEIDFQQLDLAFLTMAFDQPNKIFCVEKVHAMPQNGSIAGFKLGMAYGAVIAMAVSHGFCVVDVTPQVWKKYFGLLKTDKHESLRLARDRLPHLASYLTRVKDHNRAEAALIAEWCWLQMLEITLDEAGVIEGGRG